MSKDVTHSVKTNDLLRFAANTHSQNGEDGILAEIFRRLGIAVGTCCEFGAWDGLHFSNTRSLILAGWRGLQIEGDAGRFARLQELYRDSTRVVCAHRFVDTGANSLSSIARQAGVPELVADLDLLSVDIDGLDYDQLVNMDVTPKVICIEVNAGHDPASDALLPTAIAANNVGQPLAAFVAAARQKGYALVCYNGNAFFVRSDLLGAAGLSEIDPVAAYEEFLASCPPDAKLWLYRVNLGLAAPFHRYGNPRLDGVALGLAPGALVAARVRGLGARARAAAVRMLRR